MKNNRKFLATALTGAAMAGMLSASAGAVKAVPSTHKLYVNNQPADAAAYNIEGNNYFKLRDIAKLVDFDVTYAAHLNLVALATYRSYKDDGSNAKTTVQATDNAKLSTQTIYVDGEEKKPTIYNINGNNYFKLRDLGEMVDFSVTFTAATSRVDINTEQPYVAEPSKPTASTTPTAQPQPPAPDTETPTGSATTVPYGAIKVWNDVMDKFHDEWVDLWDADEQTRKALVQKYAPQITGKSDGTVDEVIATLKAMTGSEMDASGKTVSEVLADQLRSEFPVTVTNEELRQMESLMIEAVNEERAKAGLPVYVKDDNLMGFAQYWAQWMADNEFRHAAWSDICAYANSTGVDENVLEGGQNITMGYTLNQNRDIKKVVQEAMKNFMDSPGHKKAILYDDCTRVGIGFAVNESGDIFCFQKFGVPLCN